MVANEVKDYLPVSRPLHQASRDHLSWKPQYNWFRLWRYSGRIIWILIIFRSISRITLGPERLEWNPTRTIHLS